MVVELPWTHLQINPNAFVISILGLRLVLLFFYHFIDALPKMFNIFGNFGFLLLVQTI